MSESKIIRRSFNGGELSPELHWRSDLQKYGSSCKVLENFMVTPQGAIERRRGTHFLADLKAIPGAAGLTDIRLIPFEFSEGQCYVVAIFTTAEGSYVHVIGLDGSLKTASALPALFPGDKLYEIQFTQSYDILFMVQPDTPPQRLERHGDTDWRLVGHTFKGGPLLDYEVESTTTISVKPPEWSSVSAYVKGDVVSGPATVSASISSTAPVFYQENSSWYGLKIPLTSAPSNISAGDYVTISGLLLEFSQVNSPHSTTIGYWDSTDSPITMQVLRIEGSWLVFLWGSARPSYRNHILQAGANVSVIGSAGTPGAFYQALQDVPSGTALDNAAYWGTSAFFGGIVPVSASADFFEESDAGSLIGVTVKDFSRMETGSFGTAATGQYTPVMIAAGIVDLKTEGGKWDGVLALQRSDDFGATWYTLGRVSSVNGGNNGNVQREIGAGTCLVRGYMEKRGTADSDTGCKWVLSCDGDVDVILEIIDVMGPRSAQCLTQTPLSHVFVSNQWSRGAFSVRNGYPRTVCIHEERLFFGGTNTRPMTLWGSAVNDWNAFGLGSLETDAIAYTLASGAFEAINWMRSRDDLLIGTDGGEWAVGSRDSSAVLSAKIVNARRQTEYGSEYVDAASTSETVLFVKRGWKRVAAMTYSYEVDGYLSSDMTMLARHITGDGIRAMFNQFSPDNVVWALRRDGVLASFTFDRENSVAGWARHNIGDSVTSATAIRNGDDKDLFLAVRRGDALLLERLPPTGDNFLDAAQAAPFGIPAGSAAQYRFYADGLEVLQADATIAGIPYASRMETTSFVLDGNNRISEIALYLLRSWGGQASYDGERWQDVHSHFAGSLGESVEPADFTAVLEMNSGYEEDLRLCVRTDAPYPFKLCAIGAKIQKYK